MLPDSFCDYSFMSLIYKLEGDDLFSDKCSLLILAVIGHHIFNFLTSYAALSCK